MKETRCRKQRSCALITSMLVLLIAPSLATGQESEDDDVRPSPASIGADVPVTYFGPPPSSVEPELIGPVQLLTSGVFDEDLGVITLPLYRGQLQENSDDQDAPGQSVWYILTDTTDSSAADALGLNLAGKLFFAETERGSRTAHYRQDGVLMFNAGAVDFSPDRIVIPGNAANQNGNEFPPATAQPGAIGDDLYSPIVKITNAGGHVYNAPTVSYDTTAEQLSQYCIEEDDLSAEIIAAREAGRSSPLPDSAYEFIHDNVLSVCPGDDPGEPGVVTFRLSPGFSFAKPVMYLSTEANDPLPAALEGAIFAPGLRDIAVGRDDSFLSAIERIFLFINGPENDPNVTVQRDGQTLVEANPQRQGLNSALRGEGSPLNVLGGIPTVATDYSPLWDMNVGEWTQEAVDRGYVSRMTEEFQILGMVERGFLTGPGGSTYGSTGFIVNCPIVFRFL